MDANDNFELELLQLLAKELPVAKEAINTTFNNNDYETLHNHLHKLQGACVYCDLPDLKNAIINLDSALKMKKTVDPKLLQRVNVEIEIVLLNLKAKNIL